MTENTTTIQVWDVPVRIFHWSLVALFVVAYLTGDEENNVHIYCGYAVLVLVLLRIVWGFVGTQYARFSNFVYSPKEVFRYLKGLLSGNPKHYLGHNPAGGWMIIALLACLLVVSFSGLKIYAIEEGRGPLASDSISLVSDAFSDEDEKEDEDDEDKNEERGQESKTGGHSEKEGEAGEEFWEEIHEVSANLTVALVFLHIIGVLLSSKLHHENLVRSMITGKKSQR